MSKSTPKTRRNYLLIIPIAGGALLILVAAALMLYLGAKHLFSGREETPGMPVAVVKVTPTAFLSPTPPPNCETIIGSDDVQVTVPLPTALKVGDEQFSVTPVLPDPAGWSYPETGAGSAAWICGTVVNYVLGLEAKPDNKALLADLRPGDEIKLELSSGTSLLFRFVERQEATADEPGIFSQSRPRLTLILETGDGSWQVALADYVAETEPVQPPAPGSAAAPGQPVHVGDAQVTVERGHAESGAEGQPAGTMYYLVEFSVENIGSAPLDAAGFAMQLQDGAGNQYALSPAASDAGEYGLLDGEIAPANTAQGTAGYVVPDTLAGPTLTWVFTPQPGSELRASVAIPYAGGGGEPGAAGQANVNITDAFLSSSGDLLVIEGEISNVGDAPLTVKLDDISLTSSGGAGSLRVAAPPLPWTIHPGQTQVIELQYERPSASTALLSLLGYSFEIQGLQ